MNVILSLLSPTPGNVSGVSSVSNITATSGQGAQVPSLLAAMPPGSLIEGFVLNRDAEGNPILRSKQGDFLLKSEFFLKIGSDVAVRVDASGQNFKARLISVDGLPPQQAENVAAHAKDGDVVTRSAPAQPGAAPTGTPSASSSGTPGQPANSVAQANTSAPPQTATPSTGNPANAANATNAATTTAPSARPTLIDGLVLRSLPPTVPPPVAANTTQAGAALASANATPVPLTTPQPAALPNASAANAPPAGTSYQFQLVSILPSAPPVSIANPASATPAAATPSSAATASPTATTPQTVQATILRTLPGGVAVATSALGPLQLKLPMPLSDGSVVTLKTLNSTPPANATTGAAPLSTAPTLAQGWGSLQQLLGALAEDDPAALSALVRGGLSHVPALSPTASGGSQPPRTQNLHSGTLFFLSALGGGDIRNLLGERNTRTLEARGMADTIRTANGEMQLMRQLFVDAPPQQWQAMFVPIVVEGEAKMLRYFSKRERRKGEDGKTQPGDTRFVVEAELSQLGPLQLDGLMKRKDGATSMEMILRTHTPLPEEAQRDLRVIYEATAGAAGFTGNLMFQAMEEFPVKPLEEIIASGHREVVA